MTFYHGSGENGLAVMVDVRSEHCRENGTVLDRWALGRRAFGAAEWNKTLKISLRDYGSAPWNAKDLAAQKPTIIEELKKRGINTVVPVQSPATPNVRQVHSSWNLVGHSGNPYKWAGTCFKTDDFYVCPILHPGNYEYVYGWLLENWLRQAHQVATNKMRPMVWPTPIIKEMPAARSILRQMHRQQDPVAIDIETNMAGTIITAIGFSNQHGTISIPWDQYTIAGGYNDISPSIDDLVLGSSVKAAAIDLLAGSTAKILHNGAFDVVQLQKRGIALHAFVFDTLLMHRVCYPQFRHGLQQACATEFCVTPWKSLFKPPKVAKGEDVWLGDPAALHQYNAKDTYATFKLWQALTPKIG